MLIVVEHGDAHAGLRLLLDLETFGALDVLEVDAAEGRLQRDDDVDELVDIGFVDLDVEHVDAGEFLEQNRLALHHRLAGERADRAEAEHGGAVGQHGDEILADGEIGGLGRIGGDRLAGEGDAGRIGEREIALIAERLGRGDLQLARPRLAMEVQRVGFEIGGVFAGHVEILGLRSRGLLPQARRVGKSGAARIDVWARLAASRRLWIRARRAMPGRDRRETFQFD